MTASLPPREIVRTACQAIALGALALAFSWAGLTLTRDAERVASIWLANGLVIGVLLRTPVALWPWWIVAGFLGNIGADVLSGDSLEVAVGLALCNTFEIGLAAFPMHQLVAGDLSPARIARIAVWLVPWVFLAPVIPTILGAGVIMVETHADFWTVARIWYPADVLGIVIMTPFVLALNRRVGERLFFGRHRWHNQFSLLLLLCVTFGVFAQDHLPLLFLTFPPMLYVVFRLGFAGAALGLIATSVIAMVFTLHGHGPFALVHAASMSERVLLLQFYIAIASLKAYPVGVVLAERHALQRALADSVRRYRTLSENASDIIVHSLVDGTRDYISPSVFEVLGWNVDELLGAPRMDLVHPDDRRGYEAADAEVRTGRRTSPVVYRYLHKDGHWVWLETKARLVEGERGEPDGVITIIRDVSRRMRAEQALEKSERDLRAVTDHVPALISFVDAEGVLQFCNATHEKWLRRKPAGLVGEHLSKVFGSEVYDEQHEHLARALSGEDVEFELTLAHDRQQRHTRVSYVPRYAADGMVIGVYSMMMDTTALKTVEQQLTRLARYDSLTGLCNRVQLEERLELAAARARRQRTPLAVLFLDLDKFKLINDRCGHAVGDEVLREIGLRIQSNLRAIDIAARVGGDEFVVVLEGPMSAEDAEFVARKILAETARPISTSAGDMVVTVSIGVAYLRDVTMRSADILKSADKALYEAKAAGRNALRAACLT